MNKKIRKKAKSNPQYWYITEIESCVICGVEHKDRYRVYDKPQFSINWKDSACGQHFI